MKMVHISSILIVIGLLGSVLSQEPSYIGCFKDQTNNRDLTGLSVRFNPNGPSRCVGLCKSRGFKYAGLQYGVECFCGNEYGAHGQGKESECNMRCRGNKDNEICGGYGRSSIYQAAIPKKYGLPYLGCFKDKTYNRDLKGLSVKYNPNAPSRCVGLCKSRGFKYAGLQYGVECFCGNEYGAHGQGKESECNMKCRGNKQNQICGGYGRSSIYQTAGFTPAQKPKKQSTECWDDDVEYIGTYNKAEGRDCQRWNTAEPHNGRYQTANHLFPEKSVAAAKNYCRNPSGDSDGPWCYTMDQDLSWASCNNVRRCSK